MSHYSMQNYSTNKCTSTAYLKTWAQCDDNSGVTGKPAQKNQRIRMSAAFAIPDVQHQLEMYYKH